MKFFGLQYVLSGETIVGCNIIPYNNYLSDVKNAGYKNVFRTGFKDRDAALLYGQSVVGLTPGEVAEKVKQDTAATAAKAVDSVVGSPAGVGGTVTVTATDQSGGQATQQFTVAADQGSTHE